MNIVEMSRRIASFSQEHQPETEDDTYYVNGLPYKADLIPYRHDWNKLIPAFGKCVKRKQAIWKNLPSDHKERRWLPTLKDKERLTHAIVNNDKKYATECLFHMTEWITKYKEYEKPNGEADNGAKGIG